MVCSCRKFKLVLLVFFLHFGCPFFRLCEMWNLELWISGPKSFWLLGLALVFFRDPFSSYAGCWVQACVFALCEDGSERKELSLLLIGVGSESPANVSLGDIGLAGYLNISYCVNFSHLCSWPSLSSHCTAALAMCSWDLDVFLFFLHFRVGAHFEWIKLDNKFSPMLWTISRRDEGSIVNSEVVHFVWMATESVQNECKSDVSVL